MYFEKSLLNQEVINEIINLDYSIVIEKIERFVSEQIEKNNAEGVILGLSGGFCSFSISLQKKTKREDISNNHARYVNNI